MSNKTKKAGAPKGNQNASKGRSAAISARITPEVKAMAESLLQEKESFSDYLETALIAENKRRRARN